MRPQGTPQAGLSHDLIREIDALRPALRQLVCAYEERLSRQLAEVAAQLTSGSPFQAGPTASSTTADMLAVIRSCELEPVRGRTADLTRFEELVATLTEILSTS